MRYIINELLDPYRLVFYFIIAFALSFGPWVTVSHISSTISTVLGTYVVLIVWIIARTFWLTYKNRKDQSK